MGRKVAIFILFVHDANEHSLGYSVLNKLILMYYSKKLSEKVVRSRKCNRCHVRHNMGLNVRKLIIVARVPTKIP